jgi:hypothetical protein
LLDIDRTWAFLFPAFLAYNAPDSFVKFPAFEDQVLGVIKADDPDFLGDGFGGDKVVTGDHTHSDTCFFALADGLGYFGSCNVFDTQDAEEV